MTAPVAVIVGNPPFESSLTTEGAKRSYAAYIKEHGALADKQLAYLFLHDAMEMLAPNGVLAMVEPAGFLYNQPAFPFPRTFFCRLRGKEILGFVLVLRPFKKGGGGPKKCVGTGGDDKAPP